MPTGHQFDEIIKTINVKGDLPLETARLLILEVRKVHPGSMLIVRYRGETEYRIGVSSSDQLRVITDQLRQMRVKFTVTEGGPSIEGLVTEFLEELGFGRRN